MVTDPDRATEILVGEVISEVGKLVQQAMGKEGADRGKPQGQTAILHPVEALLDERPDEEVGRGLHGFPRAEARAECRNLSRLAHGTDKSNTMFASRSSQ